MGINVPPSYICRSEVYLSVSQSIALLDTHLMVGLALLIQTLTTVHMLLTRDSHACLIQECPSRGRRQFPLEGEVQQLTPRPHSV